MKIPSTLKQIPGDVMLKHLRNHCYLTGLKDKDLLDNIRRELSITLISRSLDRCKKLCASETPYHGRRSSIDREFALQDRLWPIAYPNTGYPPGNTAPEGGAR
jgi:hypothetical protein